MTSRVDIFEICLNVFAKGMWTRMENDELGFFLFGFFLLVVVGGIFHKIF